MFGLSGRSSGYIVYSLWYFDLVAYIHGMAFCLALPTSKKMTIFRKTENQNQREYVNVTKMVLRAKVYPIGQIMLLCKCTSLCLFDNHVELNRWLKMHWMGFVIDDRREWNDKCFRVLKLCQTILWKTICLLLFLFCFGSFPDPSVKFVFKKSIVFGFFTADVFLDFYVSSLPNPNISDYVLWLFFSEEKLQ